MAGWVPMGRLNDCTVQGTYLIVRNPVSIFSSALIIAELVRHFRAAAAELNAKQILLNCYLQVYIIYNAVSTCCMHLDKQNYYIIL